MDASKFSVSANVVDIPGRRTFPAEVAVKDGRIVSITETTARPRTYLLPGFIDAHVHIESSMLLPSEFARTAVVHGTVATVSDPHEIGNVLGVEGVRYMLENAEQVPLKFSFGAPSCVPATAFETAGAEITVAEVEELLDDPRICCLSEMMNFPGILHGDPDCLTKVKAAHDRGKPVDGHAPGLRGAEAARYIAAGITTDHECFTRQEALDKLAAGCKISIREGSAARNFDALYTLLGECPGQTMLCSDDKHPDELVAGHIDTLVRRAVQQGIDVYDALRAACIVPVEHYGLRVGLLRVGDAADFIEVDSLTGFNVLRTWIDGLLVADRGTTTIPRVEPRIANRFVPSRLDPADLAVAAPAGRTARLQLIEALDGQLITNRLQVEPRIANRFVPSRLDPADLAVAAPAGRTARLQLIEALDGQLITNRLQVEPRIEEGHVVSDVGRDILKLVVVNRYAKARPAVAFIKNIGLRRGAMASSVAHDSHNVIAVGALDGDIAAAVNLVMDAGGGLSASCAADGAAEVLPLPVAGLMATGTCQEVAAAYARLDRIVKEWGSPLRAPYMTLSFMALLVIPALKLSDRGLFDGAKFEFTPLMG